MKKIITLSILLLAVASLAGCGQQESDNNSASTTPDAQQPPQQTASEDQNTNQPETEKTLGNSYHSEQFNYDVGYPQNWTLGNTSGIYDHPQEGGVGITLGPSASREDFFVSIISSQLSTEYLTSQIKNMLTQNQSIISESEVNFGGQESTLIEIGNKVNNCTIYRHLTPHGGSWTSDTTSSSCPTYNKETQSIITSIIESIKFN